MSSLESFNRLLVASANNWWLGSLNSNNATNFWNVNTNGNLSNNNANNTNGVPV